ncbi:tRNA wybutosine-synthesizing protein 4 [[Candida] anglica]|uniref:tRNA wybutosine-synthesizing protein 4 n=1 Tax=[Candida] anglica TaxID=148631 RepID=A0ABP0EED2_9ASCO
MTSSTKKPEEETKPLTANQLARQRKKIEKDRRRKQYEDIQIQGTNNSSIVSKRSVEMLYTTKLNPEMGEWFKYFVKNPKRRSPAINRGYWIRMESIKQLILRIIEQNKDNDNIISIVNLGCGFDPVPFQLLSEFRTTQPELLKRINFIDIDYPDLVQNKLNMINESNEILSIIGESHTTHKDLGIILSTENYSLVGCNLRDSELFNRQLSTINSSATTSIFIAEVSLAYMKPEHANPVIANASKYPNSHFIILEQLLPSGVNHPFAKKMMYHFAHLRSPLGCVEKYPLISDQVERFKQYYHTVEANDLMYNWEHLTTNELKRKVSEIESFDEWEEFIIFCQHYVIVHATNTEGGEVYPSTPDKSIEEFEIDSEFIVESKPLEGFERKFPGVCNITQDKALVFGGSGQTRSNEVYEIPLTMDEQPKKLENTGEIPLARQGHTFTQINSNSALLIGGRSRPGVEYSDVYKYSINKEVEGGVWEKLGNVEETMARHSTMKLNDTQVLIFNKNGFSIYNHEKNELEKVLINGCHLSNFISSGVCYSNNVGYIVGGMKSETEPTVSDTIYKFTVKQNEGKSIEIFVEEYLKHLSMSRIGCGCHILGNKLIIAGGANPYKLLGTKLCVLTVDLDSKEIKYLPADEMLIGCGTAKLNDDGVSFVAGGGVCYSFGSYYNGVVSITKTH